MFLRDSRRWLAIVALLVLVLSLLSWMDVRFNRQPLLVFVQNGLRQVVAPLQDAMQRTFAVARQGIQNLQELGELRQENQRLRQENDAILEQALLLMELRAENSRLRELLEFTKTNVEYTFCPALIIGWPLAWSSRFILNVGTADGVRIDFPVRTPRGLIGRIVQVTSNSSELMLLSDELSGVGGRIISSGALGIVRGMGSQVPHLEMINISLDAHVEPGDRVVTSGLGGNFPPGILIGTVIRVVTDSTGLHKTATVQMTEDTFSLYEVLVIVSQVEISAEEPTEATQVEP
ncbi:MAG: rod shape-determining protein MreC [Symbiobacteriaceae bacterium]|nr:rod shape-determining protein MreC [Symbiobacteriaceae bacterium]